MYHGWEEQKKGILKGIKTGWEENKNKPDFKLPPNIIEWLIREMEDALAENEKIKKEYVQLEKEYKILKRKLERK